jgi:UDPglucose--hexose-1-phosphate uridylyltransferase
MSEIRTDPLFGTLAVVARERAARPKRVRTVDEYAPEGACPLCPGNEGLCPPEVDRLDEGGKWASRAFPNRYPALALEAEAPKKTLNPEKIPAFSVAPGFGVHEVIVESPSHSAPFWMLDGEHSVAGLALLQKRLKDLQKDERIAYSQIFKNHRAAAGGSQEHPHFQLVGMPFIPAPVRRLMGSSQCRVCELLKHETSEAHQGERLLDETSRFVALADYAPAYSYQFSIYPKQHSPGFELADAQDLEELAHLSARVIGRFERILGDLPLNLLFYTRPNPKVFNDGIMHWFIRVTPRLGRHAGLELSSGISVVQAAPEDVARSFREKAL